MTDWQSASEIMRRAGIRRICVISGNDDWVATAACQIRQTVDGDWLTVSSDSASFSACCAPSSVKNLLGREFLHGIFDARQGFHAEALACLSGTLLAGSWLLLLLPPVSEWQNRTDQDSLRWAETAQPIVTPCFMTYLQRVLADDRDISYWYQYQAPAMAPLKAVSDWQCRAPAQQQQILDTLLTQPPRVAVLTAPRGRGKSALAGMLAKQLHGALISAPAKVSVDVLRQFAGDNFRFIAPDALRENSPVSSEGWLIVDEAAAIPAPVLQQMISHFRHVLLSTTVQGYEGTGRGFLLKFCATLPDVRLFSLSEPLRWSENDPLERFTDNLFLFNESVPPLTQREWTIRALPRDSWLTDADKSRAVYQLLCSAHYRTTPLDLRRMMDAPGMHFWLAESASEIHGALWLVEEGGLSMPLSEAVWAGFRRPKGNLVAQSLAAHGGFPRAAEMRSLRISRVAVHPLARRQGTGKALVSAAIKGAAGDCDFLSVSFGLTGELWQFWQACGFRLIRIGTQREASSGCYTAMAVLPLSPEAMKFTTEAEQRLHRDLPFADPQWREALPSGILPSVTTDIQGLSESDWQELAGFTWGNRPFEIAYPALMRLRLLLQQTSVCPMILEECGGAATIGSSKIAAGGRKAWLAQLRQQISPRLVALDPQRSEQWQQSLEQLRKI